MQVISVPGGEMAYRTQGAGEPVVLVHGTPSSSHEWRYIVPALAERYRVLAPDHLGFGASSRPPDFRVYTLRWHTENLRAWLEALKLPRFHLVVHDFGGPVALPLALEQPDRIQSLTIIQSWLWDLRAPKSMGGPLMRWLYLSLNFSPRVMVPLSWGRRVPLTRELRREFLAQFPNRAARAGAFGFARSIAFEGPLLDELSQRLGVLSDIPTLVVWGLADKIVRPENLARWRSALPSAAVLELPDVGHFPQLEAPDEIAPAIARHLEGSHRR